MSTVLVTGVSGYVGSHVAYELLKAGYKVKGTVRGAKIDALRSSLGNHYPSLELVQVDDIVTGDFSEALKGVSALIHVASPLGGTASAEDTIRTAIDGSLNVLRQAVQAGVHKIVVTSSWGATFDPASNAHREGRTFTSEDWGRATREEALDGTRDQFWAYHASKILGEKADWQFAKENPSIDLATVLAPFIYGPYVPYFPLPASPQNLGTNGLIYPLLNKSNPPLFGPLFVHVHDVAKAHVLALKAPALPPSEIERKRFLVSGGNMLWRDAARYLRETRPELKSRILEPEAVVDEEGKLSTIDTSRAKELLGMDEFIGWKKTLDDAVTGLLEVEKSWPPTKI